MTTRNVELAVQLEEAERKHFEQGAADLFALQIRKQATFDARLLEVDARADYFRSQADYKASTAMKLRVLSQRPSPASARNPVDLK